MRIIDWSSDVCSSDIVSSPWHHASAGQFRSAVAASIHPYGRTLLQTAARLAYVPAVATRSVAIILPVSEAHIPPSPRVQQNAARQTAAARRDGDYTRPPPHRPLPP